MTKTEQRTIPVEAYRDDDGKPTCALDFATGKVCPFYCSGFLGSREYCVAPHSPHTTNDGAGFLKRRPDRGRLIPHKNCPVWKEAP